MPDRLRQGRGRLIRVRPLPRPHPTACRHVRGQKQARSLAHPQAPLDLSSALPSNKSHNNEPPASTNAYMGKRGGEREPRMRLPFRMGFDFVLSAGLSPAPAGEAVLSFWRAAHIA